MRDVPKVQALHMEHVLHRRRVRRIRAREPAHDMRGNQLLEKIIERTHRVPTLVLVPALRSLQPPRWSKRKEQTQPMWRWSHAGSVSVREGRTLGKRLPPVAGGPHRC